MTLLLVNKCVNELELYISIQSAQYGSEHTAMLAIHR